MSSKLFRDVSRIATGTDCMTCGDCWDVLLGGGVPTECDLFVYIPHNFQLYFVNELKREGIICKPVDDRIFELSKGSALLRVKVVCRTSGLMCVATARDINELGPDVSSGPHVCVYDSCDVSDHNNLYLLEGKLNPAISISPKITLHWL
jgi:hypothetical protein